jgi:hypothetical protein
MVHVKPVLETAAQEFADSTATPPFLFDLLVEDGRTHFHGKDGDGHGHYRVAEGLHATGVGGREPIVVPECPVVAGSAGRGRWPWRSPDWSAVLVTVLHGPHAAPCGQAYRGCAVAACGCGWCLLGEGSGDGR